ncbi:LPS translocon maturation chaperone LptM [Jeongeupia naejangsanensis]|uniref:Lipoprotein n=1 Tax=Jeongeupia naejangsanensis TaxID=613195 RepID=A0ABS2BMN8_9NEIS|nr:lipoprotein [Jeongeupia naejangsanensis]MBM3116271.1 lipoprotein [Jeongeupia naejangsanensis]
MRALAPLLVLMLAACGFKGPLYLPPPGWKPPETRAEMNKRKAAEASAAAAEKTAASAPAAEAASAPKAQ